MDVNEIFKIVKETICLTKEKNIDIDYNSNIIDIGLTSIQFIKLIIKLEEFFNIEFSEEYLSVSSFESISSIVRYIYEEGR